MKNYLFLIIFIAFSFTATASLVRIKDKIYKTGEGDNTLYWYLDKFSDRNYSEQVNLIPILTYRNPGYDWHIASRAEAEQLFNIGSYSENHNQVANILNLTSTYKFRYDEKTYYAAYGWQHCVISLYKYSDGVWFTQKQNSYDWEEASHIGVLFVSSIPEPGTIVLFGLGIVFYNRHYYFTNKQ